MGGIDDTFVIHGLNDLVNVPWDEMHPRAIGKDWSFGRGGHGYPEGTLSVTTYDPDTKKFHIWPMPAAILAMMEAHADCEVRDRLKKIRTLLEVE